MAGERSDFPIGGLGSVLAASASIAVQFFVPLWSLSAILVLAPYLFFEVVHWRMRYSLTISYVVMAFAFLTGLICYYLLVGAVSDICRGEKTSVLRAVGAVSARNAWRFLGTNALALLIMTIAVCSISIPLIFIAANAEENWVAYSALGSAIGFAYLAMIPVILVTQVIVVEKLYWLSAIKTSVLLVLRSKMMWFAFAIGMIFYELCFDLVRALTNYKYFVRVFSNFELIVVLRNPELIADGLPWSLAISVERTALRYALFPIIVIFITLVYYRLRLRAGDQEPTPDRHHAGVPQAAPEAAGT